MTTIRCGLALVALLIIASTARAQVNRRPVSPENLLMVETTKGRLLIEMRPDMAPQSVARVKLLAREGVYDGLQFHRVIPHFVAQTGNPNNRDGGVSAHANLPAEFIFRFKPGTGEVLATRASDGVSGLLGSVPFQGVALSDVDRRPDGLVRAWGAYCAGVAGMGRQQARDSGNSEIFFMLDASRNLDHEYSVWGRVIDGIPVLQSLAAGEPPAKPDVMTRVRVVADVAAAQRPEVRLPTASVLESSIARVKSARGADFTICDVEVPISITWP